VTVAALATAPSLDLGRFTRGDGALWIAAAAAVISMHVAFAYAVQSLRPQEEDGGAPPALAIELAPIPMASPLAVQGDIVEAEPSELASAAETAKALDEVAPDEFADAAEPPLDAPRASPLAPPGLVGHAALTPVDATVPDEVERETATEAEKIIPDVLEAETPEVDVPLPAPRPAIADVTEVKADKKTEAKARKPATETRAAPKKKAAALTKAAAAAKADTPSPKAAAPKQIDAVAAPRVSPDKWQSRVLSWLNRHKRYPSSARSRRQ